MKNCFKIPVSIIFVIALLPLGCTRSDPYSEHKYLVEKYCSSCHSVPEPSLLPKRTWLEILPTMGAKMGIAATVPEIQHAQLLRALNAFPEQPMLSEEEWRMIQTYYLLNSKDSLKTFPTQIHRKELPLFKEIPLKIGEVRPEVSMVRFGDLNGEIFFGNALERKLYHYDFKKDTFETFQLDGAPSHIQFREEGMRVLTMGNIHPNDFRKGKIFMISEDKSVNPIVSQLPRPVHAAYGDLNKDGLEDIVVSGFGYINGSLDWFQHSDSGYVRHTLRALPGATRTTIMDFNGDGHKDILALMAQGDEGFFLYKNDGAGNFTEQRVMSFPSTFGSTYYEIADFNNDGLPDLLYVNGDNGDYSKPVIKSYHGVRIFLNKSSGDRIEFEESYFFHMNGPFKAMAEDYDLDGDLDIACISYFPDFQRTPEEGFIYLENNGNEDLDFTAFSIPGSISGKWLVADRKDYDGDGDIDIVLGNNLIMSLNVPADFKKSWKESSVTLLLLENTTQ